MQVDLYRTLRERFHDGPYYSILGASSGTGYTTNSKANFDPFNGMPSYSGKYQKKKRLVPRVQGRPYGEFIFPNRLVVISFPFPLPAGVNTCLGGSHEILPS